MYLAMPERPQWRANQRVQPTPLAASEIVRFLKVGFDPTAFSIY
jgi:hypothetical protein